ncbi:hypothetical protein NL108_002961, partial [Boleophthalmus pectinirostris]
MWSFEDWQTTQIGCLSTKQNSFNFSPCRQQTVRSSTTIDFLFASTTASQTFFKARFDGGQVLGAFLRHTGHSRMPVSQQRLRQILQKLWLHDKRTGSVKMSQQTGQVR